jgi:hypothetical protein
MKLETKLLLLEANIIEEKDLIEPGFPFEPGDRPIGTVPMELRKLYTLTRMRSDAMKHRIREVEDLRDSEPEKLQDQESAIMDEFIKRKYELDLIKDIFWFELRNYCHFWFGEDTSIGIRKGWAIVRFKEHKQAKLFGIDISDIFRDLQ